MEKSKIRNKLPIDEFREELLKTIKDNLFCVITGETGSGKSTQIPQFMVDYLSRQDLLEFDPANVPQLTSEHNYATEEVKKQPA